MSEKLRIAIVGTGSRGTDCFGQLLKERQDVEIAALCDPNPVRAKAAAEVLEIDPHIVGWQHCNVLIAHRGGPVAERDVEIRVADGDKRFTFLGFGIVD